MSRSTNITNFSFSINSSVFSLFLATATTIFSLFLTIKRLRPARQDNRDKWSGLTCARVALLFFCSRLCSVRFALGLGFGLGYQYSCDPRGGNTSWLSWSLLWSFSFLRSYRLLHHRAAREEEIQNEKLVMLVDQLLKILWKWAFYSRSEI